MHDESEMASEPINPRERGPSTATWWRALLPVVVCAAAAVVVVAVSLLL
jgi:hypothetical protein